MTASAMPISESLRRSDKTVYIRAFWKSTVLYQWKDLFGTSGAFYSVRMLLDLEWKYGGEGGKEAGFGAESSS